MLNDLRFGIRTLLRQPGFAVAAIATLALGIGANAAIFSVVDAMLLRPLPYTEADRLVHVWATGPDDPESAHSAADLLDFEAAGILDASASYRMLAYTLLDREDQPTRVPAAEVSVSFFDVFRTPPHRGRVFARAADRPEGPRQVVLSHRFWLRYYGGRDDVVGRLVRLDDEGYTVSAIMPPGFDWPPQADAWVLARASVPSSPLPIPGVESNRDAQYLSAVGRLKDGDSLEAANKKATVFSAELARRYPRTNQGRGLRFVELRDEIVGPVRPILLVLLAAVGVVLLIACANVASLLLARGASRSRELAIRGALGATRPRLARQLFTESLIIALASGAVGLLTGAWTLSMLLAVMPEGMLPLPAVGLDWRVTAATLVVSALTGLLFGVMPAFQLSRAGISEELRNRDRTSAPGRGIARHGLVVAQVGLTFVLLIWGGLLVNSVVRLHKVDSGYRTAGVSLMQLIVPQQRYDTIGKQANLYGRLVQALEGDARVSSACVAFPSPLNASNASGTFSIEGRPTAPADRPSTMLSFVSPACFRTLGVPLLKGREFTERDAEDTEQVAVVNATLARRQWPGEDPLGRRVQFSSDGKDEGWITIVGIVGDVHNAGVHQPPPPTMYVPYRQFSLPFMTLAVRTSAPPTVLASVVRGHLGAIDPGIPIERVTTFDTMIDGTIAAPRFRALLLASFGALALLLAAIGLHGLISYSVAARVREIGIRVALGADRRRVLLPIVGHAFALTGAGIAAGLVAALASRRAVSSFLFGIGSTDTLTYVAAAVVLLLAALAASYGPARRATAVDPMIVLRSE